MNVTCAWTGACAGAACCAVTTVATIARAVAVTSRTSPAALKNRVNKKSALMVKPPHSAENRKKTCGLKASEIDDQILGHCVNFVNEQLLL